MSPKPVTLHGQTPIAQSSHAGESGASDARISGHHLRNLGFQVMAALLGIALAFM